MAGLTDKAGGAPPPADEPIAQAHRVWQESMLRQVEVLRKAIREDPPEQVAARSGAAYAAGCLRLSYWGQPVELTWPELVAQDPNTGEPYSTFDTAMLLYYLRTADGAPLADRWISFRELPDGTFYHRAFQGYSGDRLAHAFGPEPSAFHAAARALNGLQLPALAESAYAFTPLPRVRLAAVLWPGDEELPSRGVVLFDAAASHYLPTDGLAVLGAGLVRRLEKQKPR